MRSPQTSRVTADGRSIRQLIDQRALLAHFQPIVVLGDALAD